MSGNEFVSEIKDYLRANRKTVGSFGRFLREVYVPKCSDDVKLAFGSVPDQCLAYLARLLTNRVIRDLVFANLKIALREFAEKEKLPEPRFLNEADVSERKPVIWKHPRVQWAMKNYNSLAAEFATVGSQNKASNEIICLCYKYLTVNKANMLTVINKGEGHRLVAFLACLLAQDEARDNEQKHQDLEKRVEKLLAPVVHINVKEEEYIISEKLLERLRQRVNVIELVQEKCGEKIRDSVKANAYGRVFDFSHPLQGFLAHGIGSYLIFYDLAKTTRRDENGELHHRRIFYSIGTESYGEVHDEDAEAIYTRLWIASEYSAKGDSPYPFRRVNTDDYLKEGRPDLSAHGIRLKLPNRKGVGVPVSGEKQHQKAGSSKSPA